MGLAYIAVGAWIEYKILPPFFEILGAIGDAGIWARLVVIVGVIALELILAGLGLIWIGVMLMKGSRLARGLAYVAAATLLLSLTDHPTDGQVVGALVAAAAALVLGLAPGARAHFARPTPGADEEVSSLVIARVLMIMIGIILGVRR